MLDYYLILFILTIMRFIIYLFLVFPLFICSSVFSNDNLVKYEIIDFEIPMSLTNEPGNPARGKDIASSRDGNCLACHVLPGVNELFHGNIGPSLEGVGNRYNISELRLRLVNPYILNPETIMPAFYKVEGFSRVYKKFVGKPLLNAQEIEDVISWLSTLRKDQNE